MRRSARLLAALVGFVVVSVVLSVGATGTAAADVPNRGLAVTSWAYHGDPPTPPPAPKGVFYTKTSVGPTFSLFLRSDGQVERVGEGLQEVPAPDIPPLPAGLTYIDIDAESNLGILVRSDGQLLILNLFHSEYPQLAPSLPKGMKYVSAKARGEFVAAIRSDGRAVIFSITSPDHVRVTKRTDYARVVIGYNFALLFKTDGRIKKVTIPFTCPEWCTPARIAAASKVPPLPRGVRFVDAATNGFLTAYVRSDGTAAVVGRTDGGETIRVPGRPRGVGFTRVSVIPDAVVFLRTDGKAIVSGHPDYKGISLTLPKVKKGWVITDVSAQNAGQAVLLTRKIAPGEKVPTSITKVSRPTTVKHGATAIFKVTVFSNAVTRGGTVKVTYKNKTIGTGIVGDGAVAVVRVSTKSMPPHARNKVGAAFLGHGNAAKSNSATKYIGYIRTR